MMRHGIYANYSDREYRLAKIDEAFELISNSSEEGFAHYAKDIYVKRIAVKDIRHAYFVSTFCSYKGHRFEIWREEAGKLIIDTMDRALLATLNLVERERGVYDARVTPDELDSIWEEREPVYDLPFLTDPIKIIK